MSTHQPGEHDPRSSERSGGGDEGDDGVDALLVRSEGVLNRRLLGERARNMVRRPLGGWDREEQVRGEGEGEEGVRL